MYRYSEIITNQLIIFNEAMPFDDVLKEENRWVKLAGLVDWERFEKTYGRLFSHTGRPALPARMVIGALILKHILEMSDEELTRHLAENPYMQYFIGLEDFDNDPPFHKSSLSIVRKRLGEEVFDQFERYLIADLVAHKIIKPKGFLTDATVFESDITYPTDCGLLNKAREFCVNQIGHLRTIVGEKVRTYRRRAQKEYMKFTKKRQKTKADVRKMQKSLLQYLRRNMDQLRGLIEHLEDQGFVLSNRLKETFRTVREIYAQQKKMYREKVSSIPSRIVSLHKPYVRPIVRNKSGKRTEFGSKFSLSQVDGYLFVDHHDYENYNEGGYLEISVEKFQKRFGRQPSYVAMDQIYGSRENRSFLKNEEIRSSVRPLGRRSQQPSAANESRWRKQKNKERNRIEGSFGVAKEKYLLRKVRARTQQTEISWIQMGILSHNLVTAARRI